MLARRLGHRFFDLDEEVKREFHTTLEEFVHTENLRWRDQKRGRIIKKILSAENDMSGSLIERLEDLAFLLPGIGKKLPVIRLLSWKAICFQKLFLVVLGVLYHTGKVMPEYSCAVTPQVRQTGNRLSGLAGTAYASLLA